MWPNLGAISPMMGPSRAELLSMLAGSVKLFRIGDTYIVARDVDDVQSNLEAVTGTRPPRDQIEVVPFHNMLGVETSQLRLTVDFVREAPSLLSTLEAAEAKLEADRKRLVEEARLTAASRPYPDLGGMTGCTIRFAGDAYHSVVMKEDVDGKLAVWDSAQRKIVDAAKRAKRFQLVEPVKLKDLQSGDVVRWPTGSDPNGEYFYIVLDWVGDGVSVYVSRASSVLGVLAVDPSQLLLHAKAISFTEEQRAAVYTTK